MQVDGIIVMFSDCVVAALYTNYAPITLLGIAWHHRHAISEVAAIYLRGLT